MPGLSVLTARSPHRRGWRRVPCAVVPVADDEDASSVHSGGMSARPELYTEALERAWKHARDWLADVPGRRVPPRTTADDLAGVLGGPLPDEPPTRRRSSTSSRPAEPGLMAMPSGRFFGWVIGGTLPAALAADWLVSAWDQNAGMRFATPGVAAVEEAAGRWLLDLLGLPPRADVGFATGATMANFTGLAAARQQRAGRCRLGPRRRSGWPAARGSDVLVGAERHDTRRPGPALPRPRRADRGRRRRPGPHRAGRAAPRRWPPASGPTIVCLQAGNLHSGAFDPFGEAIAARARARRLGARGRRVRALGRRLARAAGTWSPATRPPTRGPPTRTRPSTCPTTAGSSSSRDAQRAAGGDGHAGQLPDPAADGPATRSRRCPSCPAGPAACRCGRRCGRSAARASPTWSTGSPRTPARWPTASPRCPASRCSTTSCSPRCASRSATTQRTRAVTERLLGRRDGLDVRVPLAGPRRAADLGEQLVDRRRATSPRRSTPYAAQLSHTDRRRPDAAGGAGDLSADA